MDEPPLTLQKKPRLPKWLKLSIVGALAAIVVATGASLWWYNAMLRPVSGDTNAARVAVTIPSGAAPSEIGDLLFEQKLIKSKLAFDIYTRVSGTQHRLQAGTYKLSPAEPLPQLITHLTSGRVESFSIMFYPGATLTDTTDKPDSQKTDVTTVLLRAGYSEQEIKKGLSQTYDHPIFKAKPATADLEGYVFGQTYTFQDGVSVATILERTFDEFYGVVESKGLIGKFQRQGLTLYEGITLASIIQREVPDVTEQDRKDQRQVAQVFYLRLKKDMQLGSDVTYHYAADKLGVARHYNLDSPYNTRRYTGLPPGPIAAPGVAALTAAASPASGKYLYFLSGDDDKTYFARTNAEHEQNIVDHCKKKCLLP